MVHSSSSSMCSDGGRGWWGEAGAVLQHWCPPFFTSCLQRCCWCGGYGWWRGSGDIGVSTAGAWGARSAAQVGRSGAPEPRSTRSDCAPARLRRRHGRQRVSSCCSAPPWWWGKGELATLRGTMAVPVAGWGVLRVKAMVTPPSGVVLPVGGASGAAPPVA